MAFAFNMIVFVNKKKKQRSRQAITYKCMYANALPRFFSKKKKVNKTKMRKGDDLFSVCYKFFVLTRNRIRSMLRSQ